MFDEDDLLPLSGLQHLSFCERRWALVNLEQQWSDNTYTVEGALLHERAHSTESESRPGVLTRRSLPLRSLRLGLSGVADVVEFLLCTTNEGGLALPRRKGRWRPLPVEYKRTRDRHGESAYRIQLCAQAMCLEEMLGVAVPEGAVFDGRSKRREDVAFTVELRDSVTTLAVRMHSLFAAGRTPPPVYGKKCEGCSMKDVCSPQAVEHGAARQYLRRNVLRSLGTDEDSQ